MENPSNYTPARVWPAGRSVGALTIEQQACGGTWRKLFRGGRQCKRQPASLLGLCLPRDHPRAPNQSLWKQGDPTCRSRPSSTGSGDVHER